MILGVPLVAAGAWLLINGSNFPGFLGRGLTKGDELRLRRAPAIYFRAMGAAIAASGVTALWAAGATGVTSTGELVIAVMLGGLVLGIDIACLAWLLIVTAQNKLFRWNKP